MVLKKTVRHLGNAYEKFDLLGQDVKLNIGGEGVIQSKVGSCVTQILACVFLLYTITRGQQLISREEVDIAQIEHLDTQNETKLIDLNAINFTVAFGVVGYFDYEPKDDPDYVEWFVSFENKVGEDELTEQIKIHKCTDEDYEAFYPIVKSQEKQLKNLKQRQAMFCIDKGYNMTLYGFNDNTDYRRFDAKLMPCKNTQSQKCTKSLTETQKYLGASQLITYFNVPRFDSQHYDDKKIVKESRLYSRQFDTNSPNFFRAQLTETELEDQITWVNIGIPKMDYFYQTTIGQELNSGWTNFPEQYRITGFELVLDSDSLKINRNAYDILGWLGDIGGVLQGLEWIGILIVGTYYAPANGNSFVVTKLFQQASREFKQNKLMQAVKVRLIQQFCHINSFSKLIAKQIHMDLTYREKIPRWDLFRDVLGCCNKDPQVQREKLLVKKGLKRLNNELDIIQILRQLRLLKLVYRARYAGRDRRLLEKLTKKVLSSDSDLTTDEDKHHSNEQTLRKSATKTMVEAEDSNDDNDQVDFQFDEIQRIVDSKDLFNVNLINIWKSKDNSRMHRWHTHWVASQTCEKQKSFIRQALKATLWSTADHHHKLEIHRNNTLHHSLTIPSHFRHQQKSRQNNDSFFEETQTFTDQPLTAGGQNRSFEEIRIENEQPFGSYRGKSQRNKSFSNIYNQNSGRDEVPFQDTQQSKNSDIDEMFFDEIYPDQSLSQTKGQQKLIKWYKTPNRNDKQILQNKDEKAQSKSFKTFGEFFDNTYEQASIMNANQTIDRQMKEPFYKLNKIAPTANKVAIKKTIQKQPPEKTNEVYLPVWYKNHVAKTMKDQSRNENQDYAKKSYGSGNF